MPRTRPSSSQRSPGVKPSMSRYQATLRSTSLTVSDTANDRRRSDSGCRRWRCRARIFRGAARRVVFFLVAMRSEEHTSELQSRLHLVCRLLLEKKKTKQDTLKMNKMKPVYTRVDIITY